ncbi:Ger(x)C family spore germination protein [Paenibacillus sp. CGMCC 1.16610]|uniref:Ger(X)C family spore germination protein n=1 Tax=Paenibacillus anseongense TaxID=2682845 RepID=A0ABW9UDX4_9BACL|nr:MULTISPECIES: Ger(x)C family spore germination protein [Paenibacillus]MBA2943655.1 Ger(x)C family spore germination protein [Paenibacillus sp. CGMCC 1.16610]MVQ37561.1 Ger(x)C family spore germination protein [Paenibacillus anseongense]
MRKLIVLTLSGLFLFSLTGCWNKAELIEYSFVQAVAIDLSNKGQVELTTLFYKPSGAGGMMKPNMPKSSFTIKTEGENVFDAIRDIALHLGRKAKWDHMRVILVSDEVVKKMNLGVVLDLFRRDHEPRPTNALLITKGRSEEFLHLKPYIEYTIGQQLHSADESAYTFTGKTLKATMLDTHIQMKSEAGIAKVPYLTIDKVHGNVPSVAGVALIEKGKLVEILPPKEINAFLMLNRKFKSSVITTSCKKNDNTMKETFEVFQENTNLQTSLKNSEVTVNVTTKLKGAVGELNCTTLRTEEEEQAFKERIIQQVKKELLTVIHHLQSSKLDAIGIGDKVFAKNPRLWFEWKENWGSHFADIRFNIHVEVSITNTGMSGGMPLAK